jgi:hypothetical protein
LRNRVGQLGVGDGHLRVSAWMFTSQFRNVRTSSFGLILQILQKRRQHRRDFSIMERGGLLESVDSAAELGELLELELLDDARGVFALCAQELLVLGLQQDIACRSFREDEETHFAWIRAWGRSNGDGETQLPSVVNLDVVWEVAMGVVASSSSAESQLELFPALGPAAQR